MARTVRACLEPALPSARRREPIFKLPGVVVGFFVVMALVQIAQELLDPEQDARLLAFLAFVPGRFTYAFDPAGVAAAVGASSSSLREISLFFLGDGRLQPWTALTYAVVHAGWVHLLSNSVWLAAFGAPVARRLGSARFLVLFTAATIGGAAAQWLADPYSLMPVVGASAGISGVMAAAVRFVFQPGAPLGVRLPDENLDLAFHRPALSFLQTLRDRRALLFIAIWFVVNLAFGLAAEPLGVTSGPIAWQAHIGGFVTGLIFFAFIDPCPMTPSVGAPPEPPVPQPSSETRSDPS